VYISRIWGEEPPARIEPKFFLAVDVRDVITWFEFGDDRLRGFRSAEGQSLPFPIDFDGRPYNTLTLPCERVIKRDPISLAQSHHRPASSWKVIQPAHCWTNARISQLATFKSGSIIIQWGADDVDLAILCLWIIRGLSAVVSHICYGWLGLNRNTAEAGAA